MSTVTRVVALALLSAAGTACSGTPPSPVPVAATAAPAVLPAAIPGCALPGAHLHAKLNGALSGELDWPSSAMQCEGMPRADGGFRLRFTGPGPSGPLVIVLGIPSLQPGASGSAVPVNLTLIPDSGRLYGTRGTDKCVLDQVSQQPLPAGPAGPAERAWQVKARGFCLEPARAVGGDDAILVTTFELTGLLTWGADDAPPP